MSGRATGLSTNSLYNSYEHFFGKRKDHVMLTESEKKAIERKARQDWGLHSQEDLADTERDRTDKQLVDLESERVGALGALLSVIDMMLAFEACDHLTWKTLREARDRYDEISKRYLDARLNDRKTRE